METLKKPVVFNVDFKPAAVRALSNLLSISLPIPSLSLSMSPSLFLCFDFLDFLPVVNVYYIIIVWDKVYN